MAPFDLEYRDVLTEALEKNLMWSPARINHAEEQTTPSWTGFNILIRDEVAVTKDQVSYLPTINTPATQMSTVFEILNQVLKIQWMKLM